MKKLALVLLGLAAAGNVFAGCPAASSTDLGDVIRRNGGIKDPALASICSRVKREGFEFIIAGDFGVRDGGSFGWANVLLSDPELGLASSSHFAASTQQSKIATPQEAEQLFLKAISAAISGMMYEDAIIKLRQSKAKISGTQSLRSERQTSAGGA